MISLKPGVSLASLKPQMLLVTQIASEVFDSYGHNCVVTSGFEGVHGPASLHYVGYSLDFRTRHLPEGHDENIANAIRTALSKEFDVVLESDHIHVEFQPKRWK